jgi:hypothetical protein
MGRSRIFGYVLSAAERKRRQRDWEKTQRERAAFKREKPPHNVTSELSEKPSVSAPPDPPSLSTTTDVTISASLNPSSIITGFDRLICNFCRKRWGEVEHMLIIAGRNAHGIITVCDECSKDAENIERHDIEV